MSRWYGGDIGEVYRAVVVTVVTTLEGAFLRQDVSTHGPYTGKRQASAAIGHVRRFARDHERWNETRGQRVTVTGHVERATTNWEPV